MAEDVTANIGVNVDTSDAISSIKNLQRKIAELNKDLARQGKNDKVLSIGSNLVDRVNATGRFSASISKVKSTTEEFTQALESNKLSFGEYQRYFRATTKNFSKGVAKEFGTISKVVEERTKDLQSQFIELGRNSSGAIQAIKIRPLALDMQNLTTQTIMAAQKMQIQNQLLKQGSTAMLNWGKNTQWAGRQLMVGFTIPLTMFATAAAKSFMDIEKQILKIQRVYGNFSTTVEETKAMTDQIRSLATEYTKYGVAVTDTLNLAADAAAAGKTGQELLSQISEATRLAVLGNVEQTQALETTMSITNAFGTATEDLASKIDFLNAVENQSVTSIEDLTEAIPKAGPVVQQLGGDVEDLAFFLTAMKEGGINASEGANALKSGLAALINPTGKAKEMLQGFGINIEKIVKSNKGDVKGLVIDFAEALDTLDPLDRARAIEQLFGKFQFSRLSTLFQNVIKDGTQAQRVLELTNASTQELAILSKRELGKIEETTTYKFEKAFADFQASIAPIGEAFLKIVTPIIEGVTAFLDKINSMGSGVTTVIVGIVSVLGGLFPAALMGLGLFANALGNIIGLYATLRGGIQKRAQDSTMLGAQLQYMSQTEIQAAASAASLDRIHSQLAQTFSVETAAVNALASAYQKIITQQKGAMAATATSRKSKSPMGLSEGIVSVPGPKGAGDVVPAMLSPGEAVIPAKQAKKYGGLINGMIAGNIPGYETGLNASTSGLIASHGSDKIQLTPEQLREFAQQKLTPGKRAYKEYMSAQSNRNIYSNLVFGMPHEFNAGKMSGTDSARWVKQNPEAFGSFLSSLEGIDAKSPAFKDFGNRLAKQLASAGSTAIDDKTFYNMVAKEISATKDKDLKAALERARSTYATGDIARSNSPKKFHREPLAGAGRSYADSTRRAKIRERFSGAIATFYGQEAQAGAGTQVLTPAQKRAQTMQRNREVKARTQAEAQAKRDATNARRRELYAEQRAAKQAAAQPAPKKPGIGSRIVSGVKNMGGMGLGMGVSVAGGAMAMIPGLEGVGSALAMIGPLFMMLPAPVAGVVAALGGLVGVVMSANAAIEANRKATVEAANANSVNNAALNQLAEDLGTVSKTEAAGATRDAAFAGTTTAQLSAGQQLLENSGGAQAILAGTQKQLEQGATADEAGTALARTLTTAVLQGIMSSGEATSLASAIAEKTGNFDVAKAATSQISQLTGNNAQDIETVLGANQGTSGAYAAIQQQVAATSSEVGKNPFATNGQAMAEAMAKPEIANLAIQEMNNYAQAVGAADVAIADASLSEEERTSALNLSLAKQKEALDAVTLYADKIGSEEFGKYVRTQVEFMYPDDPAAQSVLSLLEGDTIPDGEFKTMVSAQFASGGISPSIATYLITSAQKNKNFQQRFTLLANTKGLQSALAILAKTKKAIDIVSSNTKGVLTDLKKGQISANRLENTVANTLKMQGEEPKTSGGGTGDGTGNGTGGGGGGTKEDKKLAKYNKKIDKRQKAMAVIQLQEDAINKKYEERAKALEQIAKLNERIAQGQKDQLDIAIALSSGDIAAAARAVQSARTSAAQQSAQAQQEGLQKAKENELGAVTFAGWSRKSLEESLAYWQMKAAKREFKLASSGGFMRLANGGKVMSYFAGGGKPLGSDTIPAMLTPGEFVVKRPAVQGFGVKNLEAINSGKSPSGSVYNYSVTVNAGGNASADDIARSVMTKIKQVESQRIKGNLR